MNEENANLNNAVELNKFGANDWDCWAGAEEDNGLGPYVSGDFKVGDREAIAIIDKCGIEVYIEGPGDEDWEDVYRKDFEGIAGGVEFFITYFRKYIHAESFYNEFGFTKVN